MALSSRKLLGAVIGIVIFHAVQIVNAQLLPDFIPDSYGSDCGAQQGMDDTLCCGLTDGFSFCPVQCLDATCKCVNNSGVAWGSTFPAADVDVTSCTPTNAPPTTTATTEVETEAATTEEMTAEASTAPGTADATTDFPMTANPSTDSTTNADSTSDNPMTVDSTTDTLEPTTDEEPTDPDYLCNERSGSRRSRSRSRSSRHKSRSESGSGGGRSRSKSRSSRHKSRSESGSGSGLDCSDTSRSRSNSRSGSRSNSRSGSSSTKTGTGTGGRRRCKRAREVQRSGCTDTCLEADADGCPVCNPECNSGSVNSSCNCQLSQMCTRMGRFGLFQCVDRPGDGEICGGRGDADESENTKSKSVSVSRESTRKKRKRRVSRRKIRGAMERLNFGDIEEADIKCQDGTVCLEVTDNTMECQPEDANSNCIQARMLSSSIVCTPEGDFETRQCHTQNGKIICHCVHPLDGTPLPDTSEVTNCDALVFNNCTNKVGDLVVGVPHRDYIVDSTMCRRCLCNNGQQEDCDASRICQSIQSNPISCTYNSQTIRHGEKFKVDCNKCGCYNGHIRCTRKPCRDKPLRDRCSTCGKKRLYPVCGPNGVTYLTQCHAVYCAGQVPLRLSNGACHNLDVCSRYPCNEGDTCVKKGGVTCIGNCEAEDLRACVNVSELICPSDQEMSDDETKLCATNGVTYSSLCRLLQDSKNEGVAYVGKCGSEDCSDGKVCGADMVTYDNICVLRSTSNRFDYKGECLSEGDSVDEICDLVSESGVCQYNSNNCKKLIKPREGCCPVCGGILLIAIDLRGLREYFKINPLPRNFDSIYELLVESDIFNSETTERCDVGITLTGRNLEVILSAETANDTDFCSSESERITEVFDNSGYISFMPDVLQFASAAVTVGPTQLVEDLNHNGAMPVVATIVIYIIMAAIAVLQ